MLVSKQLETLFLDILCLTSYRSHGQMETQFLVFPSIQTCFSLLLTQRLRLIWQNRDLNIPQIPTYVTLKKRDSFPMFMVIIFLF